MSMGSVVLMPCPASGFLPKIVTAPSGEMRMNALGSNSAASAPSVPIASVAA